MLEWVKRLPATSPSSLVNLFGVVRRRVTGTDGLLHLEMPDLEGPEFEAFSATCQEEFEELNGVFWSAANGATGRLVVSYDPLRVDEETLVKVLDHVEARYGFEVGNFSEEGGDHPGDDEHITRILAQMGADMVGTGVGVARKIFRREPGQGGMDMAAIGSLIDNAPHLRSMVSKRFGHARTRAVLGVINPLIQGFGAGPVSPVVDFCLQSTRLQEVIARREAWRDRERELCSSPERVQAPREPKDERPAEMPRGFIEEYADDAWNMSLGGFIVGLADTQDFQQAITPLMDALPKPARYGREAFTAGLIKSLSERGMIVLEPSRVRLLDRIDCVIIDENLLVTDRWMLDQVVFEPGADSIPLYRRAESLFEPDNPGKGRRVGPWSLETIEELRDSWQTRGAVLRGRGPLLGLFEDDELRALFSTRLVTDPKSEIFIKRIREAGLELIISTDDEESVKEFHPDRTAPRGEKLRRFIAHLQRDYQVIAYFGDGPQPAMRAADFSVGFVMNSWEVPWNADVLAGKELDDATFLIAAMKTAREVAQTSATMAGAGAAIGAFSAIRGLQNTRPDRVMFSVNLASILALLYGNRKAHRLDESIVPPPTLPMAWHRKAAEEVFLSLGTSPNGLTSLEASEREQEEAKPIRRRDRFAEAVLQEVQNPLTPVLAAGAAVSAVVGSLTDAAIVGTVIGFNGLIGGIERYNAEKAIAKMATRDLEFVDTLRDGEIQQIREDRLVVGDIIILRDGDVVPADCRILEAERLEADESSLTGESVPVRKDAKPSYSSLVAERTSMLYEGTAIATGKCRAVVVAIGKETESQRAFRRIEKSFTGAEGVEARLEGLTKLSIPFASASGCALMALGVLRREKLPALVGPAVNLAVGAVPEGLPLLATTAQLAASRRLSERKVLVNNPRVMEALGRANVLCVDKTGTLTKGKLAVQGVFDGEELQELMKLGDVHRGILQLALQATPGAEGEDVVHGTDRAIVKGAKRADVDRGEWAPLREVPFKPQLAFHAVIGRMGGKERLVVKGSPETIMERSTGVMTKEGWKKLSQKGRAALIEEAEALGGRGLRLLAIADRRGHDLASELEAEHIEGLTFRGFLVLSDPIRKTTRRAVESLHAAGVDVTMVTGDHPSTARSIAREAGILKLDEILLGPEIDALDDQDLRQRLLETSIVARATPTHKVRIVQVLQSAGKVVAMTGDGANDAAAIRLANVGIALGKHASSAARDAADLVVTDARLETIVDAIIEGRAMWRSVRDAVSILVGGNIGEVGFMLASGATSRLPALNSRQLLLVNLFTDVAPALAIALRRPQYSSTEELLHEGPDESLGSSLVDEIRRRALLTGISSFGAWWLAQRTFQSSRAATIGLLTVVASQLGQTLTMGKPSVPVVAAALGTLVVTLAIIETPGVSQLFGCTPLGPVGLTTALSFSAAATGVSALLPLVPHLVKSSRNLLKSSPEDGAYFQEYLEALQDLT